MSSDRPTNGKRLVAAAALATFVLLAMGTSCKGFFVNQPNSVTVTTTTGGTSFSAAHTTGLAALLVQQLGHGKPAQIRERILQSADDLGQPGTDPYYGRGRINIARALRLIQ